MCLKSDFPSYSFMVTLWPYEWNVNVVQSTYGLPSSEASICSRGFEWWSGPWPDSSSSVAISLAWQSRET